MIVHPQNPEVAFAAVLGHAFGPNPERGVYRTRDGGRTWQQVLRKDADTGASDVAFDPSNPNVVFAGLWQARRRPWELVSGGPGSGLYVSRDGGDTWKALTGKGLPDGPWGKVGRRRGALGRTPRVRADRGGEGRSVPLRRRRRHLDARDGRPHAATAGLVLHHDDDQSRQRATTCGFPGADGAVHRRRPDAQGRARLPPRRSPRPLDRSEEPEADDQRERRRGRDLERRRRHMDGGAAAARAVLPRVRRHARAVPRRGRDAGSRHRAGARATVWAAAASRAATGTTSAAGKRVTSSRNPTSPTSSTPASTSGTSRATTTARGRPET